MEAHAPVPAHRIFGRFCRKVTIPGKAIKSSWPSLVTGKNAVALLNCRQLDTSKLRELLFLQSGRICRQLSTTPDFYTQPAIVWSLGGFQIPPGDCVKRFVSNPCPTGHRSKLKRTRGLPTLKLIFQVHLNETFCERSHPL